jgi:hypothetical protein
VSQIDTENEAMSPEQLADLEALMASAGGPPDAAPGAAPAPAPPALSEEIAGILKMLSKMAAPIFPSVAEMYTDSVCEAVGGAVAPVCEKHGWLQGGVGGKYGEEIMCLVIVGPLAYATYEAGKKDIAARAPAKPQKQPGISFDEPAQAPQEGGGLKTVQIGAAIPA